MAALWGASWPSGRVLAQELPPLTAASWRFGLALVLLLAWLHASGGVGRLRSLSRRQWLGLAAAGAVGVFGYAVFFMLGLAQVEAGRAALVVTSNPVLTALIAAWWFGERLDWKIGAGMLLASALMLEGPDALAAPLHAHAGVWSALLFLAVGATVLAYAWYFQGVAALGAGAAAAYISLVPVFGVLFSSLWLGEQIDSSMLVGGALAVGGMVVMNLARRAVRSW
jgi:drug/metabolite transporter (DMT)-like permease